VDILSWLWWAISGAIGVVWSVLWFLLSGWVATLAQLLVILLVIFAMKYGWQRAPFELLARARAFGRFAWGWIRAREPGQAAPIRTEVREVVRTVRIKEPGDVNLSTVLNLMLISGLLAVGAL
jgi:hypothetical protein